MELTHIRTENGTTTLITTRAALDEINAGMMDKAIKRTIRQMSASGSSANIEYRDGRLVDIRPATPEELAAQDVDVSARELADEIGVSYDDVMDAASDLASEWLTRGHRAVFRSAVGNSATISTEAADEIRKRVKPETTPDGRRIVTVKGKRYIVSDIYPARARTPDAKWWRPRAYVAYWTERNGTDFGPTRSANADNKPGTVGADIWAAAVARSKQAPA